MNANALDNLQRLLPEFYKAIGQTFVMVGVSAAFALVIGRNDPACPQDWAQRQAALWRATLLRAPQSGRLNGPMQGWQWGMKLMQEMLLS